MKCHYCQRKIPDKSFKTKTGCIWCDGEYHHKKAKKEKKR